MNDTRTERTWLVLLGGVALPLVFLVALLLLVPPVGQASDHSRSGPALAQANVSVTITAAPDPATIGFELTYIIVVENAGPDVATQVRLTDTVPAGARLLDDSLPKQCVDWGTHIVCDLDPLAPSGQTVINVTVVPLEPGQVSSDVTVAAAEGDPYDKDNTAGAVTPVQHSVTCGGVYPVIGDATVDQLNPDTALGGFTSLDVITGVHGVPDQTRALLAFALEETLPYGAIIHDAQLELTLAAGAVPAEYALAVYSLVDDWSEPGVTWNTQPALGRPFGRFTYAVPYDEASPPVLRVDVSTLATLWATHAYTHTSLALVPGQPWMATWFHSREAANPAYAPRLVIHCTAPDAPAPPDYAGADAAQQAGLDRLALYSTRDPVIYLGEDGVLRDAFFDLAAPAGTAGLDAALWFVTAYADALRLADPADALQPTHSLPDETVIQFRQLHHDVPVIPAALAVYVDGEHVTGMSGGYAPDITLDPTPRIPFERAQAIALALADPDAEVAGDTQLRYVHLGLSGRAAGRLALAWQVNLSTNWAYFIDASSGELVYRQVRSISDYDLDLSTAEHTGPSEWCVDYWDPFSSLAYTTWCDEDGCEPGTDAEGNAAFNHVRTVYDWYANTLGRDSYDSSGGQYEMYVHVGSGWHNAWYNPNGECFEFGGGYATQDVVAHEFTHGVVEYRTGSSSFMAYENEPGAINESYADIFAHYIDWADPAGYWLQGEDLPGGASRSLSDPTAYGQPDRANSPLRAAPVSDPSEANDFGAVHHNNGIISKAAFLVEAGQTFNGYTVTGLGRTKALHLFYATLQRLPDNATFRNVADNAAEVARIYAASGQYGFTTNDVCQVRNAFAAIDAGPGDRDCDGLLDNADPDQDGDLVPDITDNCDTVANWGQENTDRDSLGDACDPDDDGDGIEDDGDNSGVAGDHPCLPGQTLSCDDNCRVNGNGNQADRNNNGIGDACDDPDHDSVMDAIDNCPDNANRDQANLDRDAQGDACDPDDDADSRNDVVDNCPRVWNPGQENEDSDPFGDACDLCLGRPGDDNRDPDGDGEGNSCDDDDDNDGVLDDGDGSGVIGDHPCYHATVGCDDNCRETWNAGQDDLNGNGVGMACDESDTNWLLDRLYVVPIDVVYGPPHIPLPPECLQCGFGFLEPGYKRSIEAMMGIDFYAQVVDSNGLVVASTRAGTNLKSQHLEFQPALWAYSLNGSARKDVTADQGTLAPDAVRYWLDIYPSAGIDPTQVYSLSLRFGEDSPAIKIYLPLVVRNQ